MAWNMKTSCLISVLILSILVLILTVSMYILRSGLEQAASIHKNSSLEEDSRNITETTLFTSPPRFPDTSHKLNNNHSNPRVQILDVSPQQQIIQLSRKPSINFRDTRKRSKRDISQFMANNTTRRKKKSDPVKKSTEVDISAQIPAGQSSDKFLEDRFSRLMNNLLEKIRNEGQIEEDSGFEGEAEDDEEENVREQKLLTIHNHGQLPTVKPALECDDWDSSRGICYYDRNVGDTITFQLRFQNLHHGHVTHVAWKQEFHIRNSNHSKFVEINPDDSLWNIVIGSNGREFRVSPLTELDFDFNHFSAVVTISESDMLNHAPIIRKVSFAIRPVPNDLGSVYRGEQLVLNVESFGSLPMESLQYHWYMEREEEHSTLPSNMKVSPSGSAVVISELRMEQEGIITCAIYNSKGIFLNKKRFLIKEINRDILIHGPQVQKEDNKVNLKIEDRVLRRKVRQVDTASSQTENTNLGTPENYPTRRTDQNPLYQPQQLYAQADNGLVQANPGPNFNQVVEGVHTADTKRLPPSESKIYYGQSNIQPCLHPPCTQPQNTPPRQNGLQLSNEINQQQALGSYQDSLQRYNGMQLSNENQQLVEGSYQDSSQPHNSIQLSNEMNQQLVESSYQDTLQHHNDMQSSNENSEQGNVPPISKISEVDDKMISSAEDRVAEIISECVTDRECSGHASCIQLSTTMSYCRCRAGYRGSGLFCWEMIIPGRSAVVY